MTNEVVSGLLDLGTPGLLLIAVIYLWRKVENLTAQLIAALAANASNQDKANNERNEILATVRELKFWSDYKGDDPPTDGQIAIARIRNNQ